MKIVVTGGAGNLGRWVVQRLAKADHEVLVLDRVKGEMIAGVRYVLGDTEDLGQIYGALAGCDAVLHLAGISSHSITSNELTFRANTMGAFNIHEAAWHLGIKRVVTMSSEAVLGWAPGSFERFIAPDYLPIDEAHPCRAQDPYGLSKICCEEIGKSYAYKSDMVCVMLRPPWIASPEQLQELNEAGGREPDGFRLYHYIDVRDLAEVCLLSLEQHLVGFNTFFVGSGETTISAPLSEVYFWAAPELAEKVSYLRPEQAPVSIESVCRALKWSPKYSWRAH
jgi:nucleoside-diphosphate-sugar epimerase